MNLTYAPFCAMPWLRVKISPGTFISKPPLIFNKNPTSQEVALNSFTLFFFRRVFRLTFGSMLVSDGILSCNVIFNEQYFLSFSYIIIYNTCKFCVHVCVCLYECKFCLKNRLWRFRLFFLSDRLGV